MDPALEITSPFRNEAKASEGNYDQAIEQITTDGAPLMYWGGASVLEDDGAAADAGTDGERRTACSMCGERYTTAAVPKDGLYRCGVCVASLATGGRPRVFPVGTFRCCPTAQEEGDGGVVHCAGCSGWYHLRCVGLASDGADDLLRQYATLSTTKWYCMDSACCEKVLVKHLKKKK